MIDFACKEFKVEDVIKCALNLTKADLKVMRYFINEEDKWADTESLSRALELDISTMQRSVKKLHEKEILQRSQQNLDGGGYIFRYKAHSRAKIKDIVMTVVNSWADHVGQELEKWGQAEAEIKAQEKTDCKSTAIL
jgi:predicted transcriptional regulator